MAGECVCGKCERAISVKAAVIECCFCFSWYHRGCTKLTSSEFNGICAEFKKSKKHNWNCDECAKSKVMSPPSSSFVDVKHGGRSSRTRSQTKSLSDDVLHGAWGDLGVKIQDKLLNKQNVEMADVVVIILQIFNAINEQNVKLQSILEDIKDLSSDRTGSFANYEKEIGSLRDEINCLKREAQKETHPPSVSSTAELFGEMQDRASRAKNVILYNLLQSQAQDSIQRINHDKTYINSILTKVNVKCDNFKAFRLGRQGNGSRPLKVIFDDPNLVSSCLKNRKLLADGDVRMRADLTLLQREQIRNAHAELQRRTQDGEKDLLIKYLNGIPKVITARISNKNVVPKNDN